MKIACPGCQAPYTVPDEAVGKKTRCKKCGHGFAITAPPPAEEPFVPELIEEPAPTAVMAPAPVMVTLQPASSLPQKLIFAGVLGLAAGALIIVLFFILGHQATRNPNITHENYRQLQCNMTLAEIEAVLGRGTKLESQVVPFDLLENGRKLDVTEWYRWRSGGNTIHAGLNGPESPPRVAALHWSAVTPEAGGIVDETSESQYGRARRDELDPKTGLPKLPAR
jgi:predicted Zn finger-like uncharacterized protein